MASLVCTPFAHITFLDFPGDLNRSLASSYPKRPLLILTQEDYQGKSSRLPCDFSFLKQFYSTNLVFTNSGWLGYGQACTVSDRGDRVSGEGSPVVFGLTLHRCWWPTCLSLLTLLLLGIHLASLCHAALLELYPKCLMFHHHFPVWEFSLCRF